MTATQEILQTACKLLLETPPPYTLGAFVLRTAIRPIEYLENSSVSLPESTFLQKTAVYSSLSLHKGYTLCPKLNACFTHFKPCHLPSSYLRSLEVLGDVQPKSHIIHPLESLFKGPGGFFLLSLSLTP